MPSVLPDGEPAPADGALPESVVAGAADRAFGVYVHVPYCRVRCGYCDFNTYTASELGGGASQAGYAAEAARELSFGAGVMRAAGLPDREVSTVFFGGGTPTLLPASDLAMVLARIRDEWGIAPGAEVTTEANPDSVDEQVGACAQVPCLHGHEHAHGRLVGQGQQEQVGSAVEEVLGPLGGGRGVEEVGGGQHEVHVGA